MLPASVSVPVWLVLVLHELHNVDDFESDEEMLRKVEGAEESAS